MCPLGLLLLFLSQNHNKLFGYLVSTLLNKMPLELLEEINLSVLISCHPSIDGSTSRGLQFCLNAAYFIGFYKTVFSL